MSRSGVALALYAGRTGLRCVQAGGLPAADSAKPGEYAQILVSDIGTGMDAATLDHLFEPFFISIIEGCKVDSTGTSYRVRARRAAPWFVTVYSEPGQRSA